MPATKITELTAISTINTAVDPLPIVDVSDTSQASSGTTKKITISQIDAAIFGTSGSKAIVVDNVASLKALTVSGITDGQLYITRGYYSDNDGGQGAYIYDSASAASDNGGTVIAPTSGSGRFLLQYSGELNVKQFGAKGDGSTDDTSKIQSAVDAAYSSGAVVTIPKSSGEYIFTEIVNKGTLQGLGGILKLKNNYCVSNSTAYYLIHNFTDSTHVPSYPNCKFVDLIIDGNSANNTQFLVADSITAAGVNVVVKGCRIYNSVDSGIMFTFPENGLCHGNQIKGTRDLGIYINDNETASSNFNSTTSNNVISDCPYGGIGIKRSVRGHIVTGNYVYNCGNGITHEYFGTGSGGWPKQCVISNNVLYKIGYPYRDPYCVEVGIYLGKFDNGLCHGNFIYDVSGNGISVDGDSFVVSDNCIYSASAGNISPTSLNNNGIIVANRSGFSDSTGEFNNNSTYGFRDSGLRIGSSGKVSVSGGYYRSTNSSIYINQSTSSYITGSSFKSGYFGMELGSTAANVVVKDSVFDGGTGSAFLINASATYMISDCVDLVRSIYDFSQTSGMPKSKNSGIATITGNTGVQIAHGLRAGPNKFSIVPNVNSYWWVEYKDSSDMIFRTATSGNYTIYWTAEV